MARLIRKADRADTLTGGQVWELSYGIPNSCAPGFADEDSMRTAWLIHRDRLLAEAKPFTRPAAFWEFDADEAPQFRETDQTALLRQNLPLTPREKATMRQEGPRPIPEVIPPQAMEFWNEYCRAAEIRRDWLKRHGFCSQASAWAEAVRILRAKLAMEDI